MKITSDAGRSNLANFQQKKKIKKTMFLCSISLDIQGKYFEFFEFFFFFMNFMSYFRSNREFLLSIFKKFDIFLLVNQNYVR